MANRRNLTRSIVIQFNLTRSIVNQFRSDGRFSHIQSVFLGREQAGGVATPSASSILVSICSQDFVYRAWGCPVSIAALSGGSIEVIKFDGFNSVHSRTDPRDCPGCSVVVHTEYKAHPTSSVGDQAEPLCVEQSYLLPMTCSNLFVGWVRIEITS